MKRKNSFLEPSWRPPTARHQSMAGSPPPFDTGPHLSWVWSGTSAAQEKKSCPANRIALSFALLGTLHLLVHLALPDQEGHGIVGVMHFGSGMAIQRGKCSHWRTINRDEVQCHWPQASAIATARP